MDVLVGGTPCQSFSIAGSRHGISDIRGNLTFAFVELAHKLAKKNKLKYAIWENVPGVLSMPDNAFGCFLGGLSGADTPLRSPLKCRRWPSAGMVAGPKGKIAWRVFDAQYFGLAQQRKRLFVVTGFGNGADPAQILFEPKGGSRHSSPRRKQGEDLAGTLSARTSGGGGLGTDFEIGGGLQVTHALSAHQYGGVDRAGEGSLLVPHAYGGNNTSGEIDQAAALNAKGGAGRMDFESETFIAYRTTGNAGVYETGKRIGALSTGTDPNTHVLAVSLRGREGGGTAELGGDVVPALRASQGGGDKGHALTTCGVRRLTPRECERLMGFPDDYTTIIYRNRPAADGPRYKALGNSMAVPVMRWIGKRLVSQLNKRLK